MFVSSGEHDQMQHFTVSDLFLDCLPMSHKQDARLICVNGNIRHYLKYYIIYLALISYCFAVRQFYYL